MHLRIESGGDLGEGGDSIQESRLLFKLGGKILLNMDNGEIRWSSVPGAGRVTAGEVCPCPASPQ